ncbi:MAG: hypothetical protein ACRDZ8_21265 [Acidimicrobiales bacterium]
MPLRDRLFRDLGCLVLACAMIVGTVAAAVPASALTSTQSVVTPTCDIASPESIKGAQFMNGSFVNGTWSYATGAGCTSDVADMALYEQLDFNGTKVDSKYKGFTGVPRSLDAIISSYFCATCNGTWTFIWAQVLEASSGATWASPPAGCINEDNALFRVCVETKTVTL